ncbi:hypothetical protein HY483_02435 [Candidatus Woesearchaeota archaeon]|nr:hypothetical protein [Candidatus Woesearchaeota archaeon]
MMKKEKSFFRNSGKGQTSFFIIIGLAVLMVMGATFYIVTKQQMIAVQSIPSNVRPVYDFVKSCAEQVGKDALIDIGLQGGFINIPRNIERDPSAYVFQDPGKLIRTPLWYHKGEDRAPTIEEVQAELERVIENNLPECINNFEGFENYGARQEGNVSVAAILGEENVIIKIFMPTTLDLVEGVPKIEVFETTMPVKLKSILETARVIQKSENENNKLEKAVIGLLSANPNTPVNGLDFSCDTKTWRVKDVENEIKTMMQTLLPRIRIKNTLTTPFENSEKEYKKVSNMYTSDDAEGIEGFRAAFNDVGEGRIPENLPEDFYDYAHLYLDMGVKSSQPVGVSIQYYPEWDMDITINPSDGGKLTSQKKSAIPKLNFLCLNTYHFAYTMRIPVLITLQDEKAFLGEGFTFSFATPILIRNNEGFRDPKPWKNFQGYVEDEEFCRETGDEIITVQGLGSEEGLPIKTPIKDVNVSYECFGRTCNLGSTKSDGSGTYQLVTYLPSACSNPTITLEKEGYLPASEQLDTDQKELLLPMQAIRVMNLKIVKKSYFSDRSEEFRWGPEEELGRTNNATIALHHPEYSQYINYPRDNTISIAEGTHTYEIESYLTTFGKLRGGFVNQEWKIKSSEIEGKDTIKLTLVEYYPADDDEGMAKLLNEGTITQTNKPVIE